VVVRHTLLWWLVRPARLKVHTTAGRCSKPPNLGGLRHIWGMIVRPGVDSGMAELDESTEGTVFVRELSRILREEIDRGESPEELQKDFLDFVRRAKIPPAVAEQSRKMVFKAIELAKHRPNRIRPVN
jgi:hypothetical protein